MEKENPPRTLRDYYRPSHKGYRNTIELPDGNNVVPLQSDTIRLVQNKCSFHRFRSDDPNQHLKDFLKIIDSLDLNVENRDRTRLRRTVKLQNDILMFQQHQGESISEAWTCFKDLLQKFPHHEDLAFYDNESWNDPRDLTKPVKAIFLPQDVPSTSDCHLIEFENQVQHLMEAHLAPNPPVQVNKIASSERVIGSIFGVKEISLGDEEVPYWTTFGKRESYEPRPSTDCIGARHPYYAKKYFMDYHLPGECKIARDAELNLFKEVLVFRNMKIFQESEQIFFTEPEDGVRISPGGVTSPATVIFDKEKPESS
nr:MAK10-like protein [Tanacetum cinerariifolium]